MGKQVWITDGVATKQFGCAQILPYPADFSDREMSHLLQGFQNLNSGGLPGVFVTDFIGPSDIKNDNSILYLHKTKEIAGLFWKRKFCVVYRR